jgi:signal transduction histidine kinase
MHNDQVNILLVDDQQSRLLSYQSILHDLGQNLICASSGVEALSKLMQHEFAVVLLDVSMPGMDGFETAAMIHEHPRYERTPIIFVTGVYDTEMDRLKGYKVGAVDYVSIPVVPEILRSKVSVLVELHHQRRELQRLNASLADANAQLGEAHRQLQEDKNRELEAANRNLQRANSDLANANMALQAEIGERLRAEQALREADRQKDEFIAILAHELRNPLAPIRNALDIMAKVVIDHQPLVWSRTVIARQIVHLTRLIDDLLDISRITRGTINLTRAPVSVGSILEQALEAVQPVISENEHQLVVDCVDEAMIIQGDATRLVQILGNLLSNAAKYTNRGGRIDLRIRPSQPFVEFRIKDNGVGIPPESIGKLFHLFTRLPETVERRHDGLGIGLALVRKLVDLHDGEVTVNSAGVNQGSEFIVRLPMTVASLTLPNRPTNLLGNAIINTLGHIAPAVPKHYRVVVADDNLDALDSLVMLLEISGHEVWKATNGKEAIAAATVHKPDVILLDIGMPHFNGYEVAERVRAEPWGRNVTLVAISGWGQADDKNRSDAAGFDFHLVKPVDFAALEKILSCSVMRAATA